METALTECVIKGINNSLKKNNKRQAEGGGYVHVIVFNIYERLTAKKKQKAHHLIMCILEIFEWEESKINVKHTFS